jgi:DNA-binding response OmpR family regulator
MARFLIADDEAMISFLLQEWLEEMGYEAVGPARNVATALALIDAQRLDGAIVDVGLGRESGYPIAERLAQRGIPFVFGTGRAEGSLQPPFAAARVLTKPFGYSEFEAAIAWMLAQGQAR